MPHSSDVHMQLAQLLFTLARVLLLSYGLGGKKDELMEKLSGSLVCNRGHGEIVFRSSMIRII